MAVASSSLSAGYIVWMAGITLAIMVVMVISFRRWRVDYCGRRHSVENDCETSDANSDTTSTYSGDAGSIKRTESPGGHDNKALAMENIQITSA